MVGTVAEQVLPLVEAGKVPVIGGFVGASPEGITTTLGRGGGDTTAAMVGAAGDADELQIWTDVDGLMSADPRLVPEASCLPEVSFGEASDMASFGARVLHPASVSPAVAASIPVRVLNSRRPERTGTVVRESSDPTQRGIVSLASRSGMTAVFLDAERAVPGSVFRQQIAERLSGSGSLPELAQISAVGALAVFREAEAAEELGRCWAGLGQIRIVENTSMVAAVGDRLREDHALKGEVCRELAALAPLALGAGGTALSVYALYPHAMLERAVRQLHRRFFQEVSRT
jgi:aspartate kinase